MSAVKEFAIQLLVNPNWMAEELQTSGHEVKHSYGLEVPLYLESDIWWMPQEIATKICRSLDANTRPLPSFESPGPKWLQRVNERFLQRQVTTITVSEVTESKAKELGEGWWKAAEAKIDDFPAQLRSPEKVILDILEADLPPETILQFTSTTLDIKNEFRFVISGDTVKTGSLYLTKDKEGERTYYDGANSTSLQLKKANDFAQEVVEATAGPSSYVLDIAELNDGTYCVLEANPIWCSAWYGSDIEHFIEALRFSQEEGYSSAWQWEPDEYLKKKVSKQRMLPFREALIVS